MIEKCNKNIVYMIIWKIYKEIYKGIILDLMDL